MAAFLLVSYFSTLAILAMFGVHRLVLTLRAVRAKSVEVGPCERFPSVLVQLPVYNEALVVERLLRAAGRLDWPSDRLEIQVLDDSNDGSSRAIERVAAELRAGGVPIQVIRRADRIGYKAGALAVGLTASKAEVVAIFDADFVPPPEFLKQTVPALMADSRCGMVQARWTHLNRGQSWLTRAQAIFLDAHFRIEHRARAARGLCFNFNGTAGVWRRAAIEEAGGWSHDTITEDLDLSYRAQLAGWHFEYLDHVVTPAELPSSWMAFRAQQARWVRGSVETFRKIAPRLLRHRGFGVAKSLEAWIHISSNFAYLLMGVLALLLPLAVFLRDRLGWRVPGGQPLLSWLDYSMLFAGTLTVVIFYATALIGARRTGVKEGLPGLLFALCVGAGMSLSNGREVLRGLFSRNSEFVRTPKRGDQPAAPLALYRPRRGSVMALFELLLAVYFGVAISYAMGLKLFAAIPFLLLYFVGFTSVSVGSIAELFESRPKIEAVEPASIQP